MDIQLNYVILYGNVATQPAIQYDKEWGEPWTFFRLYVDSRATCWFLREPERSYVPVVVYGAIADDAAEYLKIGSPVCVVGKIRNNRKTTRGRHIYTRSIRFFPKASPMEQMKGNRKQRRDAIKKLEREGKEFMDEY